MDFNEVHVCDEEFCVVSLFSGGKYMYILLAEFEGEREGEDFVFQIICRLKHVSR